MAYDTTTSGMSAMSLVASLLHTLERKGVITSLDTQGIVRKAASDLEPGFDTAAENIRQAFKDKL